MAASRRLPASALSEIRFQGFGSQPCDGLPCSGRIVTAAVRLEREKISPTWSRNFIHRVRLAGLRDSLCKGALDFVDTSQVLAIPST